MRVLIAAVVALALLFVPSVARAQDSDAPPGALPHWLPSEQWVYQHWLPFDESRLYRLLRADRGEIWRHLRDDAVHDLEQLGRRRGMGPRELATRLVAPRRATVSPATFRLLRDRAERVLTQGHLSQHILFHSLHQSAVPNASARIFGVARPEFLRLRRTELSPLQIGRLYGRTTAQIRRRTELVLRDMARRGVRERAFTRRQARLLLDRQLRQVPRWLGQSRYNGPPPTIGPKKALLPPADFANNPSLSDDGRRLVWDAYRAKIPEARSRGEIVVRGADLDGELGVTRAYAVSPPAPAGKPFSAYNAVLSADGSSVVYELAAGNLNFAKRYSEMSVVRVHPLGARRRWQVSHPRGAASRSRTAYNPSLSADGSRVAFEATDAASGAKASRNGIWVADGDDTSLVGRGSEGAVYEPRITDDGRTIVVTAADAGNDGRTLVYTRPAGGGATTLVSRGPGRDGAPAADDATEPDASADGKVVAFASSAGNLGARGRRPRIWVRDVAAGTNDEVSAGVRGFPFGPAISPDGRFVAFAARPGRRSARRALVYLHDRRTRVTTLVSRADGPGGAPADGYSSEPALSVDGTRVAFASTSSSLSADKPGGIAGVFVRDLRSDRTILVSTHEPVKPKAAAAARRPHGAPGLVCRLAT